MIRLVIALVGIFLIWVLFFSGLSKERKLAISAIALLLSVSGLWYESTFGKPVNNLVSPSQINSCGTRAEHSYRSNFDVFLCLENTADVGLVKRLSFSVKASRCDDSSLSNCTELEQVKRGIAVNIPPNGSQEIKQNLSFSSVAPDAKNIVWSIDIHSVKASK